MLRKSPEVNATTRRASRTGRTGRTGGMFLRQAFDRSTTVGGIVPSGPALARKMVASLAIDQQWVVELGPGTGVFTEELLARGQPKERLLLVEANPTFAAHLAQKFPGVMIIEGDARDLQNILAGVGLTQVMKIISGLPFRSFDPALRADITAALGHVLGVTGVLLQFTYATKPPLPVEAALKAGLSGKRGELVLANMPPAFIWRYEKVS